MKDIERLCGRTIPVTDPRSAGAAQCRKSACAGSLWTGHHARTTDSRGSDQPGKDGPRSVYSRPREQPTQP